MKKKKMEDSSVEILLFFGSIYRATKTILQKLNVVVPTKEADPSLPIENPSPHEPLLASSLHSLSVEVDTVGSLTGLISDEEAQHENVEHVVCVPEIRCSNEIQVEISPCLEIKSSRKAADPLLPIQNPQPNGRPLLLPPPQICSSSHSILEDKYLSSTGLSSSIDDEEYSPDRNEVEQDHVVSVIDVEIGPCLDEIVAINSTREEEREIKEQVERSIVVVEDHEREAKEQAKTSTVVLEEEKRIKHYSSQHKILSVGEHVVSVLEMECSKEIDVENGACLDEIVEMNSTREEERKAKELQVKRSTIVVVVEEREAKKQVKSSIVVVEEEKRIKHYSSRHNILLVGEGDFSFSACLALAFGSAANIIATSLNSHGKPFYIQRRLSKQY